MAVLDPQQFICVSLTEPTTQKLAVLVLGLAPFKTHLLLYPIAVDGWTNGYDPYRLPA